MQHFIYIITYPFLIFLAFIPFRAIYILSDFAFFFLYYVIGYRKSVVKNNLQIALPHLSKEERKKIEIKFYHHLCDLFLEMIKTKNMSEKEMRKRFRFTNVEIWQELINKNKSVALVSSHYANYEWMSSMAMYSTKKVYLVYKKISNPYFDKLFKKIRSKFKTILVPNKNIVPIFLSNAKKNRTATYIFVADQSPSIGSAHYWQKFMGMKVPVHVGAEVLSKRTNMDVAFFHTRKIKRGYYESTFEIITENIGELPNYTVTDKYISLVEKQIIEAPEFYFWTHKRWKLARNTTQE